MLVKVGLWTKCFSCYGLLVVSEASELPVCQILESHAGIGMQGTCQQTANVVYFRCSVFSLSYLVLQMGHVTISPFLGIIHRTALILERVCRLSGLSGLGELVDPATC